MYNSKELILDNELTFLSYNQTINKEFTVSEIKTSDLWKTTINGGLIRAIPLFNCDEILSSNESDIILDSNKCVICQDVADTLIQCISNDTGGIHYYTLELYAFTPYSKLDLTSELTVYVIVYDEYLNTLNDVPINVLIDDTVVGQIQTDNNGIGRFPVNEPCEISFEYNGTESNPIQITRGE